MIQKCRQKRFAKHTYWAHVNTPIRNRVFVSSPITTSLPTTALFSEFPTNLSSYNAYSVVRSTLTFIRVSLSISLTAFIFSFLFKIPSSSFINFTYMNYQLLIFNYNWNFNLYFNLNFNQKQKSPLKSMFTYDVLNLCKFDLFL